MTPCSMVDQYQKHRSKGPNLFILVVVSSFNDAVEQLCFRLISMVTKKEILYEGGFFCERGSQHASLTSIYFIPVCLVISSTNLK